MASRIENINDFDLDMGKGIILNLSFRFMHAHPTLHADLIRRDTSRVGGSRVSSDLSEETKGDNPYSTPTKQELSLGEDLANLKDVIE